MAQRDTCSRCGKPKAADRFKTCERCREHARNKERQRRANNPEYRQYQREHAYARFVALTPEQRAKRLQQQHSWGRVRKAKAIAAYGGRCACCGETRIEFLTLHHIDGDGAEQRLALTGNANAGGSAFYAALVRTGFPTDLGLEVLCWNCHMAVEYYGTCPHQEGI